MCVDWVPRLSTSPVRFHVHWWEGIYDFLLGALVEVLWDSKPNKRGAPTLPAFVSRGTIPIAFWNEAMSDVVLIDMGVQLLGHLSCHGGPTKNGPSPKKGSNSFFSRVTEEVRFENMC